MRVKLTNMSAKSDKELSIIQYYFDATHKYDVIFDMLSTLHDIKISVGTLKTRLKEACLS